MKTAVPTTNDTRRSQILRFLYDRNSGASSARGKNGAAIRIGDLRRGLKEQYGLSREEVISNLRYLISQGWAEEQTQARVVPTTGGRQIPSTTTYFAITASGIDKIEGPSEYTPRDRFSGIVKIEASGQSVVTVGDGNQVSIKYEQQGEALAILAEAIKKCDDLSVSSKMDAVADIDTIQSQLARTTPSKSVIGSVWSAIEPLGKIISLADPICVVADKLSRFLS